MSLYQYDAHDSQGRSQLGTMEARSAEHAHEWLRSQGLTPIDVVPVDPPRVVTGRRGRSWLVFSLCVLLVVALCFGICWVAGPESNCPFPFLRDLLWGKSEEGPPLAELSSVWITMGEGEKLPLSGLTVRSDEVAEHVGETVWVTGTVDTSFLLNDVTYLCFGKEASAFAAEIHGPSLGPVGPVPIHRQLRGRQVYVQGEIVVRDGRPCLEVSDLRHIAVRVFR
jgi:hypothetical protein